VGQARQRPKHLAAKLLQIRERRRLSQTEIAFLLAPGMSCARVSEYEHNKREPNVLVLLAYARLAKIPVEYIIDDDLDLDDAFERG
jgi:transcriptional regulator with XRE-family HTH domain